jgi:hypothetical protein
LGRVSEAEEYGRLEEDLIYNLNAIFWNDFSSCYHDITIMNGTYMTVDHIGYVSIFPFLFGAAPDDRLEYILDIIEDEEILYTE